MKELEEKIKKTLLFDDSTKNMLCLFLPQMGNYQKEVIERFLNKEKEILLTFLKTMVEKKAVSFTTMKSQIETLHREKRFFEENFDSQTQEEIENILLKL